MADVWCVLVVLALMFVSGWGFGWSAGRLYEVRRNSGVDEAEDTHA